MTEYKQEKRTKMSANEVKDVLTDAHLSQLRPPVPFDRPSFLISGLLLGLEESNTAV